MLFGKMADLVLGAKQPDILTDLFIVHKHCAGKKIGRVKKKCWVFRHKKKSILKLAFVKCGNQFFVRVSYVIRINNVFACAHAKQHVKKTFVVYHRPIPRLVNRLFF